MRACRSGQFALNSKTRRDRLKALGKSSIGLVPTQVRSLPPACFLYFFQANMKPCASQVTNSLAKSMFQVDGRRSP